MANDLAIRSNTEAGAVLAVLDTVCPMGKVVDGTFSVDCDMAGRCLLRRRRGNSEQLRQGRIRAGLDSVGDAGMTRKVQEVLSGAHAVMAIQANGLDRGDATAWPQGSFRDRYLYGWQVGPDWYLKGRFMHVERPRIRPTRPRAS